MCRSTVKTSHISLKYFQPFPFFNYPGPSKTSSTNDFRVVNTNKVFIKMSDSDDCFGLFWELLKLCWWIVATIVRYRPLDIQRDSEMSRGTEASESGAGYENRGGNQFWKGQVGHGRDSRRSAVMAW
jgi:hypothetical protein